MDATAPATLTLVCGLPGAGKTTVARALERETGAVRLAADDWFELLDLDLWDQDGRATVERLQWQVAEGWLAAGRDVVIEWGTWTRRERDHLRAAADRVGAAVRVVDLDPPLDVLFDRVTRRGREDPPITRADLEEWSTLYERPDPDELDASAAVDVDVDGVRELEAAMWQPDHRTDREWMAAHLADEFHEIGRSGRTYDRTDILDELDDDDAAARIRAHLADATIDDTPDIAVRFLVPGLVLLTYRSHDARGAAHRTSLWRADHDGWRILHHQGTPIP